MRTNECELDLILFRQDDANPRFVRVLYVTCSDQQLNNISFLRTELDRIGLNMKLLQTFVGEQIFKLNRTDRKTFRLVSDSSSSRIVEEFKSGMSLTDALRMKPSELFVRLAEEIKQKNMYDVNVKFVAILSFTVYKDEATQEEINEGNNKVGYCALGKLSTQKYDRFYKFVNI